MIHYDFLVTGGTGLIGSALIRRLPNTAKIVVLSRQPAHEAVEQIGRDVTLIHSFDEIGNDASVDTIINLAGEPIADKPWTDKRLSDLRASRIALTEQLATLTQRLKKPCKLCLSGSAIGVYQANTGKQLDESAAFGDDFAATLCRDWEAAASKINAERLCLIRTGLVMAKGAGMLKKLYPSFVLGGGSVIGSGEQIMSWIHIDDMVGGLQALIKNQEAAGAFNFTAPEPVSNRVLSDALASSLNRPRFMVMPAPIVKLIFGKRAPLLLGSHHVLPTRLSEIGYIFKYHTVQSAFEAIYG